MDAGKEARTAEDTPAPTHPPSRARLGSLRQPPLSVKLRITDVRSHSGMCMRFRCLLQEMTHRANVGCRPAIYEAGRFAI